MWPKTVRKEDLEITYYRGSGPGGQHRNKTDSACRIKHKPTGITTQSEEHKSQLQNKKAAFKRLADQLVPLMKKAHQIEIIRSETDRIRTYHEPRQQVKDHRTNKTYNYDKVLNGNDLQDVIKDLKADSPDEA